MTVFQPIAHFMYDEFCYTDCESIKDENLVNGDDGMCECKEGFGWEDEPYFSPCVSCDQLYPGCGECDFIFDECTTCLSEFDALRPDYMGCQPKLAHCSISLSSQTADFFETDYGESLADDNGFFVCPQCNDGYFWVASTPETHGYCRNCYLEMDHCMKCHTETRCNRCDDGFIVKADETGCMEPIPHCIDNPHNYNMINYTWFC
jgi:hypothetical protein